MSTQFGATTTVRLIFLPHFFSALCSERNKTALNLPSTGKTERAMGVTVMNETIYRQRSLDELTDPWLRRSLRAWRRIANTRGRFESRDDLSPVLDNRELLLPASTLLLVDGSNPFDCIVIWQGPLAQVGLARNLVGCRWGDYFDHGYAAAAADRLKRAMGEAEIAYDEVWAEIGGRKFHYDRLAFPVVWKNHLELLLMVAKWRSPALHYAQA